MMERLKQVMAIGVLSAVTLLSHGVTAGGFTPTSAVVATPASAAKARADDANAHSDVGLVVLAVGGAALLVVSVVGVTLWQGRRRSNRKAKRSDQ
jgi:hypothetical protein